MAEQIVDLMEANMPVSSDVVAEARSAGGTAGEQAARVVLDGFVEENEEWIRANGIPVTKYGTDAGSMQRAASEASLSRPLLIDTDVTLGAGESLDVSGCWVVSLGRSVYLEAKDISGDVDDSVAGMGFHATGTCRFTGVRFVSESLYMSWANRNNGGALDRASNRVAVEASGGVVLFERCTAERCGLLYMHQGGSALVESCRGVMSEMFVHGAGRDSFLRMSDCDVEENGEAGPDYYHALYSIDIGMVDIGNCRFSNSAPRTDALHLWSVGHEGSPDAQISIHGCRFDGNGSSTPFTCDYGRVTMSGCSGRGFRQFLTGTSGDVDVKMSGCRFEQEPGSTLYAVTIESDFYDCSFSGLSYRLASATVRFHSCRFEGYFHPVQSATAILTGCEIILEERDGGGPNWHIGGGDGSFCKFVSCHFVCGSGTSYTLFSYPQSPVVAIGCLADGFSTISPDSPSAMSIDCWHKTDTDGRYRHGQW